jgi:hypothetical protein
MTVTLVERRLGARLITPKTPRVRPEMKTRRGVWRCDRDTPYRHNAVIDPPFAPPIDKP